MDAQPVHLLVDCTGLRSCGAGKVEAGIRRWKEVIGDGLRLRIGARRPTEVEVAVHVVNRMLVLARPN
jgi:hypothetical protein